VHYLQLARAEAEQGLAVHKQGPFVSAPKSSDEIFKVTNAGQILLIISLITNELQTFWMTEYTLKNAQAFQVNLETASQIKSKAAFFIHAS
jgi:hypothetical protein